MPPLSSRHLNGGKPPSRSDFLNEYTDDYIKIYSMLSSVELFNEKINKFGSSLKSSHGLSYNLKIYETKCWFPDVEVVPTAVLPRDDFYDMIAHGVIWKDVGAALNHGLYSHRLQWHVILAVVTQDFTVPKATGWDHGAYDLFVSFGSVNSRTNNVWGKLFDNSGTDAFRAPENVERNITNNAVKGLIKTKYEKYQEIYTKIKEYAQGEATKTKAAVKEELNRKGVTDLGVLARESNTAYNQKFAEVNEEMWGIYYFTQRNIKPATKEQKEQFRAQFKVEPQVADKSKRYTQDTIVYEHNSRILRLKSQAMPDSNDIKNRRQKSGVEFVS